VALLPLAWMLLRRGRARGLAWPSAPALRAAGRSRWVLLRHAQPILRLVGLGLLIVALARPQASDADGKRSAEGLDVMLVVDTSGSMRAQDFEINGQRPSRLEVIKQVIADFITARPDDRIGLVVFGSEAFTQAPLTLDQNVLLAFLNQIKPGMAGDATAIGDGLATAVRRIADVKGKGRVVILLTDGANNAGRIDPVNAAEAAAAVGVKVYTVGVGSRGKVPIIANGQMQQIEVDIDEPLMERVANTAGGRYFRATDTKTLAEIYDTIDRLEKTRAEIAVRENRRELFPKFLWAALLVLLLELGFGVTRFVPIP